MIDIGGPTMVRAAAKNCDSVTVATSPRQYEALRAELTANDGCVTETTRKSFAAAAFLATAQ